jgi:hypothetical protein
MAVHRVFFMQRHSSGPNHSRNKRRLALASLNSVPFRRNVIDVGADYLFELAAGPNAP